MKEYYYFIPPPLSPSPFTYQSVNNDKKLQKDVTEYYYNNLFDWIETDRLFKPLKKERKFLETKDGLKLVYKVLKHLVKKNKSNWFDLRSDDFTKEYLATKLITVLHL